MVSVTKGARAAVDVESRDSDHVGVEVGQVILVETHLIVRRNS